MASTDYAVLGQVAPADTNLATLYTVPTGKRLLSSTISVCKSSAAAATYDIPVQVAGAAAENKQYLAKNVLLPAGNGFPDDRCDRVAHRRGFCAVQCRDNSRVQPVRDGDHGALRVSVVLLLLRRETRHPDIPNAVGRHSHSRKIRRTAQMSSCSRRRRTRSAASRC